MTTAILHIDALSLRLRGGKSLTVPRFRLHRGMLLRLFGPIGSGKTSLLHLLTGLEPDALIPPWSGSIKIAGQPLAHYPLHRHPACMVWQDQRLFTHLSPLDNVCFPLRMLGMARQERSGLATAAFALLGAAPLIDRPSVERLSGGERQQVVLARALAQYRASSHAMFLLLDEPFHNLEIPAAARALSAVHKTIEEKDGAAILVSHDRLEMTTAHEPLAMIHNQVLQQFATLAELLGGTHTSNMAEVLGFVNRINGNLTVDVRAVRVEPLATAPRERRCEQMLVIQVQRAVHGLTLTGFVKDRRWVVHTDDESHRTGDRVAVAGAEGAEHHQRSA